VSSSFIDAIDREGPKSSFRAIRAHNSHNAQPGDPAKAAAAMVKITEVERPPLRLQLGQDCVAAVEAKLEYVKQELEQWRHLAESTAFTE
jgi:hypothetical protein